MEIANLEIQYLFYHPSLRVRIVFKSEYQVTSETLCKNRNLCKYFKSLLSQEPGRLSALVSQFKEHFFTIQVITRLQRSLVCYDFFNFTPS